MHCYSLIVIPNPAFVKIPPWVVDCGRRRRQRRRFKTRGTSIHCQPIVHHFALRPKIAGSTTVANKGERVIVPLVVPIDAVTEDANDDDVSPEMGGPRLSPVSGANKRERVIVPHVRSAFPKMRPRNSKRTMCSDP
jgi:hypothetical protein